MVKNMKKTFVVKIGSSVLLTRRNRLDEFRITHIADQIVSLKEAGIGVVLVISGAVACGSRFIDLNESDDLSKRLSAGIGQVLLTNTFYEIFKKKRLQIAQVLLTKKDLYKKNQIVRILHKYVEKTIIPVINENDVVDLNSFYGNDFLGARISILLQSTGYIILSTMKGSQYGVGGSQTKQDAINILKEKNIATDIVDGKVKNILFNTIL